MRLITVKNKDFYHIIHFFPSFFLSFSFLFVCLFFSLFFFVFAWFYALRCALMATYGGFVFIANESVRVLVGLAQNSGVRPLMNTSANHKASPKYLLGH